MSSNPYAHFLNLSSEVSQPDHYELLGVERFAEDVQAIKLAAAERNRQLHKWQNNDAVYPQVRKLQMEVALAMNVLMDADKRRAYDESLTPISMGGNWMTILRVQEYKNSTRWFDSQGMGGHDLSRWASRRIGL